MLLARTRLGLCVAWLSTAGCTSAPGGAGAAPLADAGCPRDLPARCADAPPSYARDIAPIVERRCFPCHASGGGAGPRFDFTTYDGVYRDRGPVLDQVYGCVMPPGDAGQPTAAERAALLEWLVCGAHHD